MRVHGLQDTAPRLTTRESAVVVRGLVPDTVRRWWPHVRIGGGLAVLALLMWRLGGGPFVTALRVVDARTLALAAAIGVLTTVFSAWRWVLVSRGLGLRLPLGTAVADYYRALFLNAVLPGGVLGDVDRAVRQGRDAGDVGLAVKAVVLERTAGQVVLAVAGVGVVVLAPGALPAAAARAVTIGAGVLALVLLLAVVAVRASGRPARLRGWLGDVRRGLAPRGGRGGVLLASGVVLAGHLTTFLLAARAAGSTASVAVLAPLAVLALAAMAVPLNVGGWGPREGVTAWAFAAAGMTAAQGLTVAVVYGVFALVAGLPGAAVVVARVARHRARRAPQVVGPRWENA
jgi:uncharacterized membrane protein YbhN (UPF0104 family)